MQLSVIEITVIVVKANKTFRVFLFFRDRNSLLLGFITYEQEAVIPPGNHSHQFLSLHIYQKIPHCQCISRNLYIKPPSKEAAKKSKDVQSQYSPLSLSCHLAISFLFHSLYSPGTIGDHWFQGLFFRMQHSSMNCKQASDDNIPRRAGTHKVIRTPARLADLETDQQDRHQETKYCHVFVSFDP